MKKKEETITLTKKEYLNLIYRTDELIECIVSIEECIKRLQGKIK